MSLTLFIQFEFSHNRPEAAATLVGAGLHSGPPRLLLRVFIELPWHAARWSRVRWGLIMAGDAPARVSDAVIAELRGRERDGLIELPKAPGLKPGDHVRIIAGPFSEHLALYEGQTSHERVAVLLQFLGGRHRTELRRMPSNRRRPCRDVAGGRAELLLCCTGAA